MYFNPYEQAYISQNGFYPRSIIYPRFNTPIRKVPSINLSKILETTQRGINTINQIVPIYKQVTPIVKQVGSFTKSISSFFSNGFQRQTNNPNNNSNTTFIKEEYRQNSNPNNPFFK